jgi:hypothetical protein
VYSPRVLARCSVIITGQLAEVMSREWGALRTRAPARDLHGVGASEGANVRTKQRKTKRASGRGSWIRWDSPRLLPSLGQRLGDMAATWNMAAVAAPDRPDASRVLAVARTLTALREALKADDEAALQSLGETAGAYLRRRGRDVVGARSRQVTELARLLGSYCNIPKQVVDPDGMLRLRSSKGDVIAVGRPRTERVPPDQMAEGFLRILDSPDTPLQREFVQLGIRVERERGALDPDVLQRVRSAFERELERSRRPSGQRLVEKGLEAIGYPSWRSVFSFEDKRVKRAHGD